MIHEVVLTPLAKFPNEKGQVLHGLKKSEDAYVGFGEAYFSLIVEGETKGWKRHRAMTMNLVVPVGNVRFHVFAPNSGRTRNFDIGEINYARLTIPPGLWVAFTGLAHSPNLVFNFASHEHDPDEVDTASLSQFSLVETP